MRIVNVTTGDTGNQSYALSKAVTEHTRHKSRSFVRQTYFEWPYDVIWRPEWNGTIPKWIQSYWYGSDIVHLHNRWQREKYWHESPKAAWIVHQHGQWPDEDRYAAELAVDRRRGAIRVVSTLNLLEYVCWNLERWFPKPIRPIFDPKERWGNPLHIVHCPTVKSRKNTVEFVAVMERLQQRFDVTYEIVTQRPHSECMLRKARADILFDQLTPCYGTNSLEAWALGIPVVCGVSEEVDDFLTSNIGKRPYVLARTEDELYDALKALIRSQSYREYMADIGNRYVRRWHSPEVCANIAIETYREAMGL